jgi:TRAP-type C4-dicarboxylate transport system permease small subunit
MSQFTALSGAFIFFRDPKRTGERVSTLEKLSFTLNAWIEYLLFGLGFTMTVVVAVQVLFRYGFNYSLFWSEELARYILVWLSFLGASVAYRRKAHPGIDILQKKMPGTLRKFSITTVHLASLTLFFVMIFFGCRFAYFVRLQISPALYLPKWIVFGIIPISGFILMIHCFNFLMQEFAKEHRDH